MWGNSNDKVYKTNPHTLDGPKHNIRLEISTIIGEEPQRVNNIMFCRYIDCIPPGGQKPQHLL